MTETTRRLVSTLKRNPLSPRSKDVTTKDDRTNIFGIPYQPPGRDEAVAQYQRRSMHKLHIAEWHRAEFERLEDELRTADFFDFDTERFLPAQAHADGALLQLATGFDAFACAVAHQHGLETPDRASFWGARWVARLVEAAEPDLRVVIQSVVHDRNFAGLKFYRNLAAHRGVIGEQQRGGQVEEVGVDGVRFMLPDWLPMDAPDHPSYSVRPILRRYLEWGRPALAGLNAVASAVWEPTEQAEAQELVFSEEMFEDIAPTLQAVGLELDELRSWLERKADPLTAKAVLWHYRPDTAPLNIGRVLAPRVVR